MDFTNDQDSQSDDQVEVTFVDLTRSVINEISAPELLKYQSDVVEHFMRIIEKRSTLQDNVKTVQEKKIVDIYRLELERIKYYLQLYFRCRLLKIDKYHLAILANEELMSKLSPKELEYTQKYKEILARHFQTSFLNDIPERLRQIDEQKADVNMVPEPDLEIPVFCRVLKDLGDVLLDPTSQDAVKMEIDSIFVLKYKYIKPLVEENSIELL